MNPGNDNNDDRDPWQEMSEKEHAEYIAWSEALDEQVRKQRMTDITKVGTTDFSDVAACPYCRAKYLRDCKCSKYNDYDYYLDRGRD